MKQPGAYLTTFAVLTALLFLVAGCSMLPAVHGESDSLTVATAPLLAKAIPMDSRSDDGEIHPQVTATQPTDGSLDVDPFTQIMVVFSRPIVPLTSVDEQGDLPHPLTIDPETSGRGAWISTSVYSFQPDTPLHGATTYNVSIVELLSVDGAGLAAPVEFTFTTSEPTVVNATPVGDRATPDTGVTVEFSQSMDTDSTAAAFSLSRLTDEQSDDATEVVGEIVWDEAQRSLTFTPTNPLEFGQSYAIDVTEAAVPDGGVGNLRESFTSMFSVVPYPNIVSITPADGEKDVLPDANVVIRFSTHVSRTQVLMEVSVTPVLSTTSVYSYYSRYNDELVLSWYKEPQTEYTIIVGGDIQDDYGNVLGEDRRYTFTTGDYAPFVDLELEWFTHFTTGNETRVGLVYRNVDRVDVDLFALPQAEALSLAGLNRWQVPEDYTVPNPEATRIWSRSYDTTGDPNVSIRQIITVTNESGDPLPPGAYFMDVISPHTYDVEGNPLHSQAALLIGNANLVIKKSINGTSLAWLTNLTSGQPIGEIPIAFYVKGEQVGTSPTDDDGLAMLGLDIPEDQDWFPVIAVAGQTGEDVYTIASSDWNSGIAPWDFGLSSGSNGESFKGHFYTDRPIYRPGDTVNWKGIVRRLVDDAYELPPADLPIRIKVRNDMGNVISEEFLTPNELGTVHGETELLTEAGTGFYHLDAMIGADEADAIYSGVSFQVAEYRKPEFEVSVQPESPEYVNGETVRIQVDAAYFSGSPLTGALLTWRLISQPYTFSWSDEDGRRYTFSPYDANAARYDPYQGVNAFGLVNEGSGVTNADGSYTIELPADVSQSLTSQRWSFDVTVQSGTNQFVTGRTSVPVHRAQFYIGLSPRYYVVQAGEEVNVDIVTLTPQSAPYPGAELDVTVYDFEWNSVYERSANGSYRWETSVERTPTYTGTVTSNRDGHAVLSWSPTEAGQYQIVTTGKDETGNPSTSAGFLWVSAVSDDEYVSWPMENNDRIEIVADKQKYEPGDVARILVPSPFQGSIKALVTEERSGVLAAEVHTLQANSEILEIPITEKHIPNLYVGVMLTKGIDDTNPYPAMRVGYTMLKVDTSVVELNVDTASSAQVVEPGDPVTYTLQVTDKLGNPQANAELSAALVDKAVLTLAGGDNTTLLDAFYNQRPLDVETGASLVINRDRVSQQLTEGAKGGGGGGGGTLEVRSDFRDVAFWQADLRTDSDGKVQFMVELPDSLTTWQLLAKAVTEETKVGESTLEVVATKELQVRPLVPRFLTEGDRPWLGAQVVNTSEVSMSGVMTYSLAGASFQHGQSQSMEFNLAPGEQKVQTWFAELSTVTDTVNAAGVEVLAVASAIDKSGALYQDAVSLEIPVLRYESPETVATAGTVPPAGVTEYIVLPEDATEQGQLNVRVEPSLASGMLSGLEYLEHYPYECNEQIVSRFLPNLVTVRALRVLEIEDAALEAQLSYQLGIGVQRLVTRQNPDGGWGYWPGEESSPFITAYVLWGISLAEQLGYAVPESTLDRSISYLDGQFEAPHATMSSWRLNEVAFVHYILSELGEGDPGRASTLYNVRENLGIYGKALLAMALDNMSESDSPDAQVQTLLDDIVGATILSATGAHWEENEIDYRTLSTDTRSTSIALDALTRLRPDLPVLPQVVRWLMVTRETGRWSNTQENTWAIISLTDWMVATRELEADYEWTVMLNGIELGSGTAEPNEINPATELTVSVTELLRAEANQLAFSRTRADGQLYYTTHLQYYLDASAIDARDRGIVIGRRFQMVSDPDGGSISSVNVGDVVSVTVTIVAPNDLHHLLVETPIPAGTEPIDPGLAITDSRFDEPSMSPVKSGNNGHGWGRQWVPTYTDYRDDKVALFATYLPAGVYEYTFNTRATLPGEYRVLPAQGEMMYFTDVWGRSEGALFTVKK